jgi:FkbM family methyltransferase
LQTFAPEYLRLFGVRGLVGAATAKVCNRPVMCRVSRPHLKHEFVVRIPSTDVLVFRQIFDRGEYEFEVRRPPRVIVDAGANVGLSTIFFANKYPDARIIAVEPEARNFAMLANNVAPYANVTPVEAAVWSENTDIDLFDPGIGSWGFLTRRRTDVVAGRWCQKVRGFTIDRLLDDFGLAHVDVLKLDIEGAEREVLNDSTAWIGRVDAIIAELHDRFQSGCRAAFLSATKAFAEHWHRGESEFVARHEAVTLRPSAPG